MVPPGGPFTYLGPPDPAVTLPGPKKALATKKGQKNKGFLTQGGTNLITFKKGRVGGDIVVTKITPLDNKQ